MRPTFADKLDLLFTTTLTTDRATGRRREHHYREVSEGIAAETGVSVAIGLLHKLRHGGQQTTTIERAEAIASWFGEIPDYFLNTPAADAAYARRLWVKLHRERSAGEHNGNPDPVSSPIRHRRAVLAGRLRALREAATLTPAQVDHALGRRPAVLSALENGDAEPTPTLVGRLLTLYGVREPHQRECVLSLARGEREPLWCDDPVIPLWLATTCRLEQQAAVIRTYQTQFIPPLLQTEEYARAVVSAATSQPLDTESVEAGLRLTLARQDLLIRQDSPVIWAIVDQSALRRRLTGPGPWQRQLDALILHAKNPRITLQIAPMEAPAYLPRSGPFTLMRFARPYAPEVFCMHSFESDVLLTNPSDVESGHKAFTRLSTTATMPDETLALLHRLRDEEI
ncbi:helix-turn-helix domain-containing protein [Bailinhaonella thermotolerans]|uniref:helix-turn-helix domain-containing protein n=1 Tax=Bailinhaonella thermotolerans TaxID=1070861 RepID=UPI00192A432A|nr:helix-turn-helix transcriptional regulator [Bailinhaonella thermotolerans]